jgi:hypothetical protein
LEIQVDLTREADNEPITYFKKYAGPSLQQTITLPFPVAGTLKSGHYRVSIQLDPRRLIREWPLPQAEENNALDDGLIPVLAGNASAVYPPPYGVVSGDTIELLAALADPPVSEYRFELDTLETFDSPFLKSGNGRYSDGLLHWRPVLPL